MTYIMTVLGPISPQDLGFTSMHEHVLLDTSSFKERYDKKIPADVHADFISRLPGDLRDNLDSPVRLESYSLQQALFYLTHDNMVQNDEEWMAGELIDFKASGGSALLDASAIGLRLNIPGIKRLSERSGIHIVTCTGFYAEDFLPKEYREYSIDQYHAYIVAEMKNGIVETDVYPGHIKLAITDLSVHQEYALRGGARAAMDTGASVSVHPGTGIGSDGRRIAKILIEEGLAPDRILINHSEGFMVEHDLKKLVLDPESWKLNLDYHHELLDKGVNLSIDCFGHHWDLETDDWIIERDWHRLAGLVALIREGYSSQLVLGTDTFLKTQTRRGGGEGYCRLTRYVLPTLRKLEIAEYEIRQITVVNPARLLTIG